MKIAVASPNHPQIQSLLKTHLAAMHTHTPPEFAFALDGNELASPEIKLFAAWDGEQLMGMGALKALSDTDGEVKSMRTHPDFLRRGVGTALMEKIISAARDAGLAALFLETGTSEHYDAATALYERFGFTYRPPFGDYKASPHNQFMELRLRTKI